MKDRIISYFEKEKQTIDRLDFDQISDAVKAISAAYDREATIYVFGNGGSAATASHFVCDFNKGISEGKSKKFHLICLNDNVPIISAIGNDISYDEIYRFQLKGCLKEDDLIIAISGSGNSKNVLLAAEYAREIGTKIVGITGYNGGRLDELSDYHMHVPIDDMQITEDLHMSFDHMMYRVLCDTLK